MPQPRSRRFSSAHVMAAIALFVSLGGTSYAVATLPRNSVGSAQVKNGTLAATDLAKGVVSGGAQGPAGARGPRGADGSPGPVGPAGVSQAGPLVSSLPTPPADGQEVFFQSSAMASAGVVWHLRYRAAAPGPYKWEYVGGPGLYAVSGYATTASESYLTANVGPSITVPLAGEYDADISTRIYHVANGVGSAVYAVLGDGNGAFPNTQIDQYQGSAGASGVTLIAATNARSVRLTRGTPGVVDFRFYSSGGTAASDFRDLRIRPVRVG